MASTWQGADAGGLTTFIVIIVLLAHELNVGLILAPLCTSRLISICNKLIYKYIQVIQVGIKSGWNRPYRQVETCILLNPSFSARELFLLLFLRFLSFY